MISRVALVALVFGLPQPAVPKGVCAPRNVVATKVVEQPAMRTGQGACSQAAIDSLYDACFQSGGDCTKWKASNSACSRCVFTPAGSKTAGPFITRENDRPKANQRGCLDSLAPGCGSAYEAATACTHAACDGNPDCASATTSDLAACRQVAMRGTCRPLMQTLSARCGEGGMATKRVCFPQNDSDAALRSYIRTLALRACGSK